MRRPAMTRAQRQHAREQRALLQLRRTAVRYSVTSEAGADDDGADLAFAFADLTAACDAYANILSARERRKLVRRVK